MPTCTCMYLIIIIIPFHIQCTEEFIQLNMSAMGPRVTLVTDNSTMAALYLDIISGSESQVSNNKLPLTAQ